MATINTGVTLSGGFQLSGGYTISTSLIPGDPYWPYVSYLSQTSATNAQQNNTFLDASINNFTITRNGSTTQGPVAPFGANWSNYFNGSTDYLTLPSGNAALQFTSSDFTLEAWVYPSTFVANGNPIFALDVNGSWYASVRFGYNSSGAIELFMSTTGAAWAINLSSGIGTVALNTWQHVALSKSGTSVRVFLNGVQQGATQTLSGSLMTSTNNWIGYLNAPSAQYVNGYISNARIVKGTALYTANFTPSTTPLTPITNTSLLTCQSPSFQDNGPNAFTLTASGSPQIQRFNPFSSYLQTPNTYSTKFNGTSDYLATPSTLTNITGNFTMEAWVYPTLNGASNDILTQWGPTAANLSFIFRVESGRPAFYWNNPGSGQTFGVIGTTTSVVVNQWSHIAVTRSGSTIRLFVNGTTDSSTLSAVGAFPTVTCPFYIGTTSPGTTEFWNGYISNLRFVNGTALYTANFTVPTAPLTAITNTALLTLQNATFVDNSTNAFALTVGGTPTPKQYNPSGYTNTVIQTYDPTINGGSMYFNGTTDYLTATNNTVLQFGTGDYTIEFWMYQTTTISNQVQIEIGRAALTSTPGLQISTVSGVLTVYGGATVSTTLVTAGSTLSANSWYHVALTRSSSSTKLFINGVQTGSTATDSTNYTQGYTWIASGAAGSNLDIGYISNLRIIKGTALYTTNFVSPQTPLISVTNTQLLLNGTNAGIYDASMINNQVTVSGAKTSTSVVKYGSSSMAFNGSTDYLAEPSNIGFSFGTGDFTIEGWFYSGLTATGGLFQVASTAGGFGGVTGIALGVKSGKYSIYYNNGSSADSTGLSISANVWNYFTVVKSNNVTKIYLNGVLDTGVGTAGSIADTTNYTGTYLTVGGFYSSQYVWNGNISDLRITKGFARYTTNFTPPTSALTNY